MNDLQQAIFDRVKLLDREQQQTVLAFLESLKSRSFDATAWEQQVDQIHAELRAMYGENYRVDVQSLLDEVREEGSWPRW